MIARFPGRCDCGAAVHPGDPITLAQGYTVRGRRPIISCGRCRPRLREAGPVIEVCSTWGIIPMTRTDTGEVGGYRVQVISYADPDCWCVIDLDGQTLACGREMMPPDPRNARHWIALARLEVAA